MKRVGYTRRTMGAAAITVAAVLCACSPAPRELEPDEFVSRSEVFRAHADEVRSSISECIGKRLDDEYERQQRGDGSACIDVLMLSSGGQFGAFGVGILQGWGEVPPGPMARPEFDVVTGVSTGALIAPFAFIGDADNIARVDRLYRQVDDQLAEVRGWFYFLPWLPSFMDNTGLAARIESEMDDATLKAVADRREHNRLLLIGATDLDLGRLKIWDMGRQARAALDRRNPSLFDKPLLASSAIPAAFPPVEIDGSLYADGAVAQSAFLGLDREQIIEVFAAFKRRHPGATPPPVRMWVIVNGPIDARSDATTLSWLSVAKRSLAALTAYSLRVTLRHLEFGAELLSKDIGGTVEFRFVSIPDSFDIPKTDAMFDHELMTRLTELGRKMGRDPASWSRSVGSVELPDADKPSGGK